MPGKFAQLDDPRLVRLYRLASELLESDAAEDQRLEELADILAALSEQAHATGNIGPADMTQGQLPDLLDALAVEYDPRVQRLLELVRQRGWDGWTRMQRIPQRPR
jgi:hypothetical protein